MYKKMVLRARAKINLGLTVLGRRQDGYHDLVSVMQEVSLCDTLVIEPDAGSGWRFNCSAEELGGPENLVSRAASALELIAGRALPAARITLYKNIPVESGLGGGSSDAAAALKGLNRFWGLGIPDRELSEIGATLGSDVPFCLRGGTALAEGRGEKVTSLPALPFHWVVLLLPAAIRCSTSEIYSALKREQFGKPSLDHLLQAVKNGDMAALKRWMARGDTNTLEQAVLPRAKAVAALKHNLQILNLNPALSGSGSALFFLSDSYWLARNAAFALQAEGNRAYLCWTVTGAKECLHD